MKVKCLSIQTWSERHWVPCIFSNLTEWKIYEVIKEEWNLIHIYANNNEQAQFKKERFELIEWEYIDNWKEKPKKTKPIKQDLEDIEL